MRTPTAMHAATFLLFVNGGKYTKWSISMGYSNSLEPTSIFRSLVNVAHTN